MANGAIKIYWSSIVRLWTSRLSYHSRRWLVDDYLLAVALLVSLCHRQYPDWNQQHLESHLECDQFDHRVLHCRCKGDSGEWQEKKIENQSSLSKNKVLWFCFNFWFFCFNFRFLLELLLFCLNFWFLLELLLFCLNFRFFAWTIFAWTIFALTFVDLL